MDINDEKWMKMALLEATQAFEEGEVPVGAVIVKNNELLAKGHNHREKRLSITGHAEIEVIEEAEKKLGRWNLEGCTLYVTLEPCLMCAGAIMQARLFRLVYGASDDKKGAISSAYFVFDDPKSESHPLLSHGLLADESARLLASFFANKRV